MQNSFADQILSTIIQNTNHSQVMFVSKVANMANSFAGQILNTIIQNTILVRLRYETTTSSFHENSSESFEVVSVKKNEVI